MEALMDMWNSGHRFSCRVLESLGHGTTLTIDLGSLVEGMSAGTCRLQRSGGL